MHDIQAPEVPLLCSGGLAVWAAPTAMREVPSNLDDQAT